MVSRTIFEGEAYIVDKLDSSLGFKRLTEMKTAFACG